MLWSEHVLDKNSREMERLWLAGTIAAGILASGGQRYVVGESVELADLILEELAKEKTK